MVSTPRASTRRTQPPETTAATGDAEPGLGFERVVFFSDAVFAIVITLLVLPLTTEIDLPEDGPDLRGAVLDLWPTVLTFAVTFLVVGQFWIAHHRTFGYVVRQDHTLVWLNLVTLLTVAFLPFPTALLGAHPTDGDAFPVVFYATSMTITSAALTGTWVYAVGRGLTRPSLSSTDSARITARAVITTAVFAVSIGVALLGLTPAVVCWLALLPAARFAVARFPRRAARSA